MGIYDRVDSAPPPATTTPFIRTGHYLGLIARIRSGKSADTRKGEFVAMDLNIIHTYTDGDPPVITEPGKPTEWKPDPKGFHQPGEEVTIWYSEQKAWGMSHYRELIAQILGCKFAEVTGAICAQIEQETAAGRGLAGLIVELRNPLLKLKGKDNAFNAGAPFTRAHVVRVVPADEALKLVTPEIARRFFKPAA